MENCSAEECFVVEVNKYLEYSEKMRNDFIDYWTEKNQSGKKMRFQLEKTWEIKRRLARWARNNEKFGNVYSAKTEPQKPTTNTYKPQVVL